ncbi:MAG: methyltransferase domain-containing protein [Bryobacteraceae bacterium]
MLKDIIRRMLWRAYQRLSPKPTEPIALPDTNPILRKQEEIQPKPSGPAGLPDIVPALRGQEEIRSFIRSLDMPGDDARRYLEIHLERIAITLGLTPPPQKTGKVLELGAYMHMTPALQCVLGYSEVRGAYFGPLGKSDLKKSTVAGRPVFECCVDSFDAEKDCYPYEDSAFDCVLACEIFEHFLHDPMHMLAEVNRVLDVGGHLVLTTPNVASATAVARILEMSGNPQLYAKYADPRGADAESEVGHMREYTPDELKQSLHAAGFEVEQLFTTVAPEYNSHAWVLRLLSDLQYPIHLRGEQMYCLARKVSAVRERYPGFLYE